MFLSNETVPKTLKKLIVVATIFWVFLLQRTTYKKNCNFVCEKYYFLVVKTSVNIIKKGLL